MDLIKIKHYGIVMHHDGGYICEEDSLSEININVNYIVSLESLGDEKYRLVTIKGEHYIKLRDAMRILTHGWMER